MIYAEPFLQFQQRDIGISNDAYAFEPVGRYSLKDVCDSSDMKEDESEGKWELSKHKISRSKQRYSERCPYRYNCSFGKRCFAKHSEDEKRFFRNNSGKGNPVRKVKPCKFYPDCRKPTIDCQYVHGEEDSWCLNCCAQGHSTNKCPQFKS